MKIHHFAIQVQDIEKSLEFYTKKLGFTIKAPIKYTEEGLYAYVYVDLCGTELELIELLKEKKLKKLNAVLKPPLCPHIALESFNLDEDLRELQKRGVEIFDGPHILPGDVKKITILDPDNYRIDIGQLLK